MRKLHSYLGAIICSIVFVLTFSSGFFQLYTTYTSFWLIDNTYAFGILLTLFLTLIYRHGIHPKKQSASFPARSVIVMTAGSCALLIVNTPLGGFEIIPAIATYIVIYALLGFVLDEAFWRRSIPIVIFFILTLPILERLQKFIGFPLRMMTATIVSFLLQLFGAGNVSHSTVILTENYATTIDLPCSGMKSLYFGGIIFIAIAWWLRLRLSLKAIGLAIGFFSLLILCNIWRVFSLVYVYGILHLTTIGDSIHIMLGVIGFAISCIALWYGAVWVAKRQKSETVTIPSSSRSRCTRSQTLCIVTCIMLCTGLFTHAYWTRHPVPPHPSELINFTLRDITMKTIEFSEKEKNIFVNPDVTFAAKYALQSQTSTQWSLLLVKSSSARSYHDPELCLQGLGYAILNSHSTPLKDSTIQELELQTANDRSAAKAWVYYWYVSRDEVITDYSARVWKQVQHPGTNWVLVELAGYEETKPTSQEREKLFTTLTEQVRTQLL